MRTLDTTLHYVVPSFLVVLAQAIPLPEGAGGSWAEIVRSLGVLVVLAWYMWYTTSVSNPKILEAAAKERETSAKTHKEERDQSRADMIAALTEQRKEYNGALLAATDAFKASLDKITCKFEHRDPPCLKN